MPVANPRAAEIFDDRLQAIDAGNGPDAAAWGQTEPDVGMMFAEIEQDTTGAVQGGVETGPAARQHGLGPLAGPADAGVAEVFGADLPHQRHETRIEDHEPRPQSARDPDRLDHCNASCLLVGLAPGSET